MSTYIPPQARAPVIIVVAIIGAIGLIVGNSLPSVLENNRERGIENRETAVAMKQFDIAATETEITDLLNGIAQQPPPTYTPAATYTPLPTYTPYSIPNTGEVELSQPTYTPYPTLTSWPTYTPFPTLTSLPDPTIPLIPSPTDTPTVSLPFQDDFEAGLKPEWAVFTGQWMTIDGQMATAGEGEAWITIGEESWQDYSVELDVTLNYYHAAAGGQFILGIRSSIQTPVFPAFTCDGSSGTCQWSTVSANGQIERLTQRSSVPRAAHYKIDVAGNNFTSYVNGQRFSSVSLTGYEAGSVIIGVDCGLSGCVTIDNFSVDYSS